MTFGVSLIEYLRLLATRGWILGLCALLGAGGMLLYSQRQTPVFRSTMQVLFEPAATGQGISAAMNSLLRSYVVRLHTTAVAATIVDAFGMTIAPDALKGGTEISAVPDQSLIRIEVNDTNGDWANTVALAWGQTLIDQQNAINAELPATEQIVATLHDFPRYALFRPKVVTNAMLGATAGLLLGAVLVFILERRNRRLIYDRFDVARISVLAVVPREPA
jgi:capsular polysaccharide biosynthesis protein